MFEIDLASFLVLFVDRKINDPSKGKAVEVSQLQALRQSHCVHGPRPLQTPWACHPGRMPHRRPQDPTAGGSLRSALARCFSPAVLRPLRCQHNFTGFDQRIHFFHSDPTLLRDGIGGLFAPEDIAHAGQPFLLRESVHAVAELAATPLRGWNGTDFCAFLLQQLGERSQNQNRQNARTPPAS